MDNAVELTVRRYDQTDERWLRRWLTSMGDMAFGAHSQIKDYFLSGTELFGAAGVYLSGQRTPYPGAVFFWSRNESKSFIHHIAYSSLYPIGKPDTLETAYLWLDRPECQVFVQDIKEVSSCWTSVLQVRAGDVTDHPAYDGVFSRTAPRFNGFVCERNTNADQSL